MDNVNAIYEVDSEYRVDAQVMFESSGHYVVVARARRAHASDRPEFVLTSRAKTTREQADLERDRLLGDLMSVLKAGKR